MNGRNSEAASVLAFLTHPLSLHGATPVAFASVVLSTLVGVGVACAQDSNGRILGWGLQVVVPQEELTNLVSITGGTSHSIGLRGERSIVAWGGNNEGQWSVPEPNADFVGVASLVGNAGFATPGLAHWSPEDGHKGDFQQLPDPTGRDVRAFCPNDDWECPESGCVTDTHFGVMERSLVPKVPGQIGARGEEGGRSPDDGVPDRVSAYRRTDSETVGHHERGNASGVLSSSDVCQFEAVDNCQLLGPADYHVSLSDLSAPGRPTVHADDFIPQDNTIGTVCVWGVYLDGFYRERGSYGCSDAVTDDFRVTVYQDADGLPGAIVGTSAASDPVRGIEPGTKYENLCFEYSGEPMFAFQLALDDPITGLTPGACYWLEVVNNTPAPDGHQPNACEWHWAVADSSGNAYSFAGTTNALGAVYLPGGERACDLVFCMDIPIAPGGCTVQDGACCSCPANPPPDPQCSVTNFATCDGYWDLTTPNCDGVQCTSDPPPGDDCANAIDITDGSYAFNTMCADTSFPDEMRDEGGRSWTIGYDLWYRYVASCTGRLVVSTCGTGSSFDSFVGVYHDRTNPSACPCPGDPFMQDGNGGDENCTSVPVTGSGMLERIVLPGECWLIRVAGWEGAHGLGRLDVSCEPLDCHLAASPEPGLLGPKNRYLSFSAPGRPGGWLQAIRVTLASLPPPFDVHNGKVMWVGAPRDENDHPGTFKGARLQCEPFWDDWSAVGVVHVYDDAIVPGARYAIQVIDKTCRLEFGLLSRIRGRVVARVGVPGRDRGRFPRLRAFGIRMPF